MRKSAQVTSMFRSSERTVLSSFRCHLLHLYHKKFEHFLKKNNYVISLTIEEGPPNHHSIQSAHFNNKFLPSFTGVFSLNIDESFSATFGRLWSLCIAGPKKARLKHSRPVWCMKGRIIMVNMLLLLTSVQALLISFCIFSLESLMVANDLRNCSPMRHCIPRTSLTPDCCVSGKVKLSKIIKKNCNIYH